jgi:hypothetical protein
VYGQSELAVCRRNAIDWIASFRSHVLLNASKADIRWFDKGHDRKLPYPVYVIELLNGIFETSSEMKDKYYHHYKTVNTRDTEERIDGLELILIELPKFKLHPHPTHKLYELHIPFLTEINDSTVNIPQDTAKANSLTMTG